MGASAVDFGMRLLPVAFYTYMGYVDWTLSWGLHQAVLLVAVFVVLAYLVDTSELVAPYWNGYKMFSTWLMAFWLHRLGGEYVGMHLASDEMFCGCDIRGGNVV
eukprot:TRINITY_DN195_c0_g1_i1.p3 TRINITY_DN195_c0_g1~~TRINITY_DN195_c0_g1_i1.p3  ORF type:complete len:104 (-),score=6.28 TRINITY_DN195_c0_g1_i1:874-1185(-)